MEEQINLRTIFRGLLRDESFLSHVIESNETEFEKKSKRNVNIMQNMISEYTPLAPQDRQEYPSLPHKIKAFLPDNFYRLGIKNVVERDAGNVNVSFITSLNCLLRPDLALKDIESQTKDAEILESFISHMIRRNFRIDHIKRTTKIKEANRKLIESISQDHISHELIDYIVCIFEINLIVFDISNMKIYFYWCRGTRYPTINLFKDIYAMCFIQGNYEPLMSQRQVTISETQSIYTKILLNHQDIITTQPLALSAPSMLYLDTWDIHPADHVAILREFFMPRSKP